MTTRQEITDLAHSMLRNRYPGESLRAVASRILAELDGTGVTDVEIYSTSDVSLVFGNGIPRQIH